MKFTIKSMDLDCEEDFVRVRNAWYCTRVPRLKEAFSLLIYELGSDRYLAPNQPRKIPELYIKGILQNVSK